MTLDALNTSVCFVLANEMQSGKPALLGNFHPNLPVIQSNLRDLFSKHSDGVLLSRLPQMYKETFKHDLNDEALKQIVNWTHICKVWIRSCFFSPNALLYFAFIASTVDFLLIFCVFCPTFSIVCHLYTV